MAELQLSKEGYTLLSDISSGINIMFEELLKEKGEKMNACLMQLKELIDEDFGSGGNKNRHVYTAFLAESCLLAYYQKFDNDKNLERITGKYTSGWDEDDYEEDDYEEDEEYTADDFLGSDDLKEDSEETAKKASSGSGIELDGLFGYSGLYDNVLAAVEVLEETAYEDDEVAGCVTSNLLSGIRDVTPSEYLTGGYCNKDIELIMLLDEPEPTNVTEEVIEFIKTDHNYNSIINSTITNILSIYKYLLQDSFGLHPYEGVVMFSRPYAISIQESRTLGSIKDAGTVFETVSSVLRGVYNVNEKSDRQFNIQEIIRGNNTAMYYPHKLIEYAMGRKLTYNLAKKVYKEYEKTDSWEQYEQGYVRPQVERLILEAVYFSMERHYGKKGSFTTDKFIREFTGVNSEAVQAKLRSVEMKRSVDKDIKKVMKSMCTGIVIPKYNAVGGKVNSISIRLVDVNDNFDVGLTRDLLGSFDTNGKARFEDGDIISDGKVLVGGTDELPYRIIEFRHNFDEKMAGAEPLFGYTAVRLFQRRGIPICWDRILLGEDRKGTPVFASLSDPDDIPMQKHAVHNIIAGSRAGKGVMTMNIIVSGVASKKPTFYIDRKPDMSATLYGLSQGNMFIINGGDAKPEADENHWFTGEAKALAGWQEYYQRIPECVRQAGLIKGESWDGVANSFGDIVYWRGLMLVISILIARVTFFDNKEVYEALGGDNGIIAVFDEFNNWQSAEATFFQNNLGFNNHRITKQKENEFDKLKMEIKLAKKELEIADTEMKRMKAEMKIEKNQEILSKSITELNVYSTTIMDKYAETNASMSALLNAGFKNREEKISDIFVIGQNFKKKAVLESNGAYPTIGSGDYSKAKEFNGSLMRGLLNEMSHDWFIGRNDLNYMGQKDDSNRSSILQGGTYWAYVESASMELLADSEPSNYRLFKPYLVLNNHLESDPSVPVDSAHSYVAQCRERVIETSKDEEMWERVRLKHLNVPEGAEPTEEDARYGNLHPGIGFEGLATMTKASCGNGQFNPTEDLRGSADIANYVANAMGYSNYMDLLMDLSPAGLFSSEDVISALKDPVSYQQNLEKRIPLYFKYGFMGEGNKDDSLEDMEGTDFEGIGELDMPSFTEDEGVAYNPSEFSGSNSSFGGSDDYMSDWDSLGEEEDTSEDFSISMDELRQICSSVLFEKAPTYGVSVTNNDIDDLVSMIAHELRRLGFNI